MNAGETVKLLVKPYDFYDNKIRIDLTDEDLVLSKWTANYKIGDTVYPINTWSVSTDNSYYY